MQGIRRLLLGESLCHTSCITDACRPRLSILGYPVIVFRVLSCQERIPVAVQVIKKVASVVYDYNSSMGIFALFDGPRCYYCGGLYNLNIRELQMTETELGCIRGERRRNRISVESTYDNAMAREAQTGSSRMCLMGYRTPAAIGSAVILYTSAQS